MTPPDPFSAELPVPPSTNRLYNYARFGVRRSAWYRDWRREAISILAVGLLAERRPRPAFPPGLPVAVAITVGRNPRRDLDNHAKPLLDALQAAGVLDDDRQVEELALAWAEGRSRVAAVTVSPIPPSDSG